MSRVDKHMETESQGLPRGQEERGWEVSSCGYRAFFWGDEDILDILKLDRGGSCTVP